MNNKQVKECRYGQINIQILQFDNNLKNNYLYVVLTYCYYAHDYLEKKHYRHNESDYKSIFLMLKIEGKI